ncbi:MAG: YesL family protein [Caldicoprobacterales bacterium]
MYYGDPRKPDLKKEDVKGSSRFKLFFTVLSVRFWQLIQLNLLYAVFWLPSYIWLYIQGLLMQQTNQPVTLEFFILMIPCLMLAGPATAGVTYVIRNWARDDHAWVWSDFKDAFKENWKQSILMMLINGIALLLFSVNVRFYGSIVSEGFFYLLLYYFMFILAIIFVMMNMFVFPMIVTYRLKLRQILRNAFILTMVKLPLTFVVFALAGFLMYLSLVYLLSIPFFLVGLTFPAFIVISYVNWILDKYINIHLDEEKEETEGEETES